MKDYYALLGVSAAATTGEIKRAYRRLAVQYHPDKNPDPEAAVVFSDVTEAYDVLTDPEERRRYDIARERPFDTGVFTPPPRQHRDPRYRPKPPGYRPAPKPGVADLMAEYLPYFSWLNWAGLVLTAFMVIDLLLAVQYKQEELSVFQRVASRGNNFRFYRLKTVDGTHFNIYNESAGYIDSEQFVRIGKSRIFGTVMEVSGAVNQKNIRVAYLYRTLVMFPVLVAATSLLGIVFRRNATAAFNLSIVTGFLVLINFVMLMWL